MLWMWNKGNPKNTLKAIKHCYNIRPECNIDVDLRIKKDK